MRTPIIAANWKMHKTLAEAVSNAKTIAEGSREGVETMILPPATALAAVSQAMTGTGVIVGAQNMYWEEKGAFTGEISPRMVKDCATHILIGHSERRHVFGETDEEVNKKMKAALAHDLIPILCVGETIEQREAGKTLEIVENQIRKGLEGLEFSDIIIAYEPVWAIGTGKVASAEQAQEAHALIRNLLRDIRSDLAEDIRILYGGSVNPANVAGLMAMEDIDGGLVGTASIDPADFTGIIKNC